MSTFTRVIGGGVNVDESFANDLLKRPLTPYIVIRGIFHTSDEIDFANRGIIAIFCFTN